MNLLLDCAKGFKVLYYCMKVIFCAVSISKNVWERLSFLPNVALFVSIFKSLVLSGKSFIGVTDLTR